MQNNPQYIRTDKAIKQALMKLLKTKSFEKITVQDILDETPVTRSTFYKHYHDKYEIAEKMQEDFLKHRKPYKKPFIPLLPPSHLLCCVFHSKTMKPWKPC